MMAEYISYGVLYLAEAVIAWRYFEALFCRRASGLRVGLSFAAAYILLFCATWLDSVVLNGAAFFVCQLLLLRMDYECQWRSAVLHSAFLTSVMAVTEIVAAWIISLFGYRFGAYADDLAVMIVMAVISKLLYFFVTVMAAKLWPSDRRTRGEAFLWTLCVLPIFSVVVSAAAVYVGTRAEMTRTVELLMVIVVLTLLIVNLLFVIIYDRLQQIHAEQLALELSIQKEEADAAYYRELQKRSEDQRILIHDIKSHLNTIYGMANDLGAPAIAAYIADLAQEVLPDRQSLFCQDPILNFLLQQFREKCDERGVAFRCEIADDRPSFMDAPSITTFYGNLLQNALEAAECSAERTVELSVKKNTEQQNVIVSVVNSCDAPPIPDSHGLFRTKKRGPGLHGVGLKSIRRVVERYHGVAAMRYDPDGRRFYHVVQFPV